MPVACTTPPMSSSSPRNRPPGAPPTAVSAAAVSAAAVSAAGGSAAGGITALGVREPAKLQPVQARGLRRGVVRADLRDQPAGWVEPVPLVAAQHHPGLGLLMRPLDHRPVGTGIPDDL